MWAELWIYLLHTNVPRCLYDAYLFISLWFHSLLFIHFFFEIFFFSLVSVTTIHGILDYCENCLAWMKSFSIHILYVKTPCFHRGTGILTVAALESFKLGDSFNFVSLVHLFKTSISFFDFPCFINLHRHSLITWKVYVLRCKTWGSKINSNDWRIYPNAFKKCLAVNYLLVWEYFSTICKLKILSAIRKTNRYKSFNKVTWLTCHSSTVLAITIPNATSPGQVVREQES